MGGANESGDDSPSNWLYNTVREEVEQLPATRNEDFGFPRLYPQGVGVKSDSYGYLSEGKVVFNYCHEGFRDSAVAIYTKGGHDFEYIFRDFESDLF